MIRIKCDRCDQTIELEQGVAGQKVTCPHCGDVNVLRAAGAATTEAGPAPSARAAAEDRAVKAGYPSADGPETDVMLVRPAMLRARPVTFLLLLLGAVGGAASAIVALGMGAMPVAVFAGVICLVSLSVMGVWRIFKLGEGLKITSKRIIDREGFFRKDTSEILHKDIRNVQVRQTFWQRVWGVGTLAISTAAENEDEIAMEEVPNPDKVRQVIDLYRKL